MTQSNSQNKNDNINSDVKKTPLKSASQIEGIFNKMIDNAKTPPRKRLNFLQKSPKKSLKNLSENFEKECDSRNCNESPASEEKSLNVNCDRIIRKSPRKLKMISNETEYDENFASPKKRAKILISEETDAGKKSIFNENTVLRRSPRKLQFDVNAMDVLNVVKGVYGSKNFKHNEESAFPLHQKLLICSLLLMIKKGKKQDLNIGKVWLKFIILAKKNSSAN